jgi:hypothetical protein
MNPPDKVLFVGRVKESRRIRSVLAAGHNLVLTGPFGIGRTALLRHLAMQLNDDWRFVFLDGSQTPAKLLRKLIQEWAPKRPGTSRQAATAWKAERRRLATLRSPDPRPVVIVLDDVAKVTRPQLDLVRWLKDDGRFRVIVVTERFLPEDGQRRLRARLYPAPLLTLGPLPPSTARRFFEAWSDQYGLDWGPDRIHGLTLATHGYPLGMWEAARASQAVVVSNRGSHG